MEMSSNKMNIIKQNYLRIINLVLHNESFQMHADKDVYVCKVSLHFHNNFYSLDYTP